MLPGTLQRAESKQALAFYLYFAITLTSLTLVFRNFGTFILISLRLKDISSHHLANNCKNERDVIFKLLKKNYIVHYLLDDVLDIHSHTFAIML